MISENSSWNQRLRINSSVITTLAVEPIRETPRSIIFRAVSRLRTPPAALIHALDNRKIDGAILPDASDNDALTALLIQRHMPFAAVSCTGSDAALVGKTACAELIKYLLDEVYDTDPLPGCHIIPKETV